MGTQNPQVSPERDPRNGGERVHRLGAAGAAPDQHQGRDDGGSRGRSGGGASGAHRRLPFGLQTHELIFLRV